MIAVPSLCRVTVPDRTPVTVKATGLLAMPETVTTKFPVVEPDGTGAVILEEPQVVGDALVPLNLSVLVP